MSIGMRIGDLETPAMVVDLDVMDRNLKRVADYAKEHELRLRPHTKTHKSPLLGRKQLDMGAAGLTVAKVGEAEVMLGSGTSDLLVAYPVIGRKKLERLMSVAARTNITVSLDSVFAARQLSEAARESQREIGVLAEMDAGLGRVGATPGPDLIELARQIERLPWLRFEGIAFYPGHVKMLDEEGQEAIQSLSQLVGNTVKELKQAGLEPRIVSGGSTPALFYSHQVSGVNEIRPGTYIFNDRNTMLVGACTLEECAASIMTTVVSTAKKGQIIIDGGSKTFSSDRPARRHGGELRPSRGCPGGRVREDERRARLRGHAPLQARIRHRRPGAGDPQPCVRRHESARVRLRLPRGYGGTDLESGSPWQAAIGWAARMRLRHDARSQFGFFLCGFYGAWSLWWRCRPKARSPSGGSRSLMGPARPREPARS